MIVKKLKAEAHDNRGKVYPVQIDFDDSSKKWTLSVVGLGGRGQWYLHNFTGGNIPEAIAIDFGSQWGIVNFRELVEEALTLI